MKEEGYIGTLGIEFVFLRKIVGWVQRIIKF